MPRDLAAVMTIPLERDSSKISDDPREIPLYTVANIARFLQIPNGTLWNWTRAHAHQHNGKVEQFAPLITVSRTNNQDGLFSFYNAIEAHVLIGARRYHGVSMLEVNRAVGWVRREMPSPHPLADYQFSSKGKHIFVEMLNESTHDRETSGSITDASQSGQTIISEFLDLYLKRIDRDPSGNGFRFFPVAPGSLGELHPVMMDIHRVSGNLVIAHTAVSASVVHGRFKAGHSIEKLSRDYRLPLDQIEGAIQYFKAAA